MLLEPTDRQLVYNFFLVRNYVKETLNNSEWNIISSETPKIVFDIVESNRFLLV